MSTCVYVCTAVVDAADDGPRELLAVIVPRAVMCVADERHAPNESKTECRPRTRATLGFVVNDKTGSELRASEQHKNWLDAQPKWMLVDGRSVRRAHSNAARGTVKCNREHAGGCAGGPPRQSSAFLERKEMKRRARRFIPKQRLVGSRVCALACVYMCVCCERRVERVGLRGEWLRSALASTTSSAAVYTYRDSVAPYTTRSLTAA